MEDPRGFVEQEDGEFGEQDCSDDNSDGRHGEQTRYTGHFACEVCDSGNDSSGKTRVLRKESKKESDERER